MFDSHSAERDPLCLCDLDAALLVGGTHDAAMKLSTAYAAPELHVARICGASVTALPSLDVWSLGVLLFEVSLFYLPLHFK